MYCSQLERMSVYIISSGKQKAVCLVLADDGKVPFHIAVSQQYVWTIMKCHYTVDIFASL